MPPAYPPSPTARALDLLRRAARITPYFLIMASGGKDSNVAFPLLMDLQREMPQVRIAAQHWYTIPPPEMTGGKRGMECVERPLRILAKQARAPIFWAPHYTLTDALYLGEIRPPTRETRRCERCLGKGRVDVEGQPTLLMDEGTRECPRCRGVGMGAPRLRTTECEDAGRVAWAAQLAGVAVADLMPRDEKPAMRSLDSLPVHPFTGIWTVWGQRLDDSLQRRAMITSFRAQRNAAGVVTGGRVGLNLKERRVFPIASWSAHDVLAFARARKLPPAASFGAVNTTNLDPAQPIVVECLKRYYPRDYERLLEVFPNARALSDA